MFQEPFGRSGAQGEQPQATSGSIPEATGLQEQHGAGFDTFLCFSAKTWQYTSRAPAELGFLSVSKEESQPLVTWQEKERK